MEREKMTEEDYQELIDMKPHKRVREGEETAEDDFLGILIGFARRYDMRDGYIDIITTSDARKEFKQLMKKYCNS